ncbi:MAG: hypothetical protein IH946_08550, partial [Bacteroidetes bacterium]|nr:hypothetical protein [Bacteroidota bacterium]
MVLYFKEPRLNLTKPGEFLVRLVTYSSYIVLSAATLLMLFSDISSLRWVAALLALFLIDRALHLGEAERSLSTLKGEKINLAQAITPAAYRALNYSFRKALLTNQNFYLILLKELMQRNDIKSALRRLSVSSEECLQKIEEYLEKSTAKKMNRAELLGSIETLVIAAYENAARTSEHFIESRNIFVALSSVGE